MPKDAVEATRSVRVWDLPTRVFHWALVAVVLTSYVTGEWWRGVGMTWHFWSGYAILALVLFRLCWGLVGTRYARFSDFLRGPVEIARYGRDMLRGRAGTYPGHNPLGALSSVALLAVLVVQAGSGLFASDDIFVEGPLAGLVGSDTVDLATSVHHTAFDVLLGLVGLHLAAIAFYEAIKGQRLVRAMVLGRKRLPADAAPTEPVPLAVVRGVMAFAVAAAAVAALVFGLPAWAL